MVLEGQRPQAAAGVSGGSEPPRAEEPRQRGGLRPAWVTTIWILVTLLLAGGMLIYRYQDPKRIEASGDSYWYMRQALMFTGKTEPEATRISAELICADMNRSARDRKQPETCTSYDVSWVPARYIRIFTARPGYPLFAAPFVATLGTWHGMLTATVILVLAAVVLAFLAVFLATGYRLAGFVAALALIALPSGFWMTRMLTEGGLMAGYLAVILGVLVAWRGRYRLGLPLIGLALVWLFAVKSASGMAAAAVVIGASLIGLIGPRGQRRGPLVTGGLSVVLLAVWTGFSSLTHQPGLYETVQDFAANHFRKPDVPDPYPWLYRMNIAYWPHQWQALLRSPKALIEFGVATVLLIVKMRREAALFVFTGLIGVAMQVAHPYASQWDRMNVSLWLVVAAAAGVVVGWAGDRLVRARRRGNPQPQLEAQPLVEG
jgi:hypothetical protein